MKWKEREGKKQMVGFGNVASAGCGIRISKRLWSRFCVDSGTRIQSPQRHQSQWMEKQKTQHARLLNARDKTTQSAQQTHR